MSMIIRRTTAYLLAFSLVFSLLPLHTGAEEPETMPPEILTVTEPTAESEETEPLCTEEITPETDPSDAEVPEETEQPLPEEPTLPTEETLPEEPEETLSPEPEQPQPEDSPSGEIQETVSPEPEETLPETTVSTEPEEPLPEEIFYPEEIPDDFVAPLSRSDIRVFSLRLPAAYDSREAGVITPVQNQDSWQLCWAFSALAVGESYIISSGQGSPSLSERHLGYYFHGRATDPLGYAAGDGTYLAEDYLVSGNNNKFTTFALANWVGAASEEKYPYDRDPSGQENASAMDDVAHLTNAYWINAQDTDTIKHYIMRNGSVGLSFYYASRFYNEATAAYYNPSYTTTNHAITVVGWDDNYSADNFAQNPEQPGAWLCKNSHGSDFGMDGYFWLSYQDLSITHSTSTAFVFEFESGANYDWNYHHDGSFGTATETLTNGGSIANVYTASGSSDGTDELIRAVGVALADTDLSYSIQIYRNLTNPADPTSGTPALPQPQEGQTSLCGYYTIPLEQPVQVLHGETFSVVITLHSKQASDILYFVDRSYSNGAWIRFSSSTSPGQSFCGTPAGQWTDLATLETASAARIKAYTDQVDSRSISRLTFAESKIVLTPDDTYFQEPEKFPEDADPCLYRWHSDRETVAAVSETGLVTAVDCGEAVITASTPEGSVSASYLVSVRPKIHAINLQKYKSELLTGESFETSVELFPEHAAPYYVITLESSDETVVSVDGMTLQAHAPGTAVITVRAEPYYREYTVTVTHSLIDAKVTVAPAIYDGTNLEPEVTVELDGTLLEKDRDYTLVFANNKFPGTGSVTVNGIGSYSGGIWLSFPITLPETRILSLENETGGIRMTWESCPGVSGYYVYRQKNLGSWKKIKTIAGKTNTLDTDVSSGNRYDYKVIPYLKSGSRVYKAPESSAMALYRLSTPKTNPIVLTDTGLEIRWKRVTGADSYQIYRSTPDSPEELAASVTGGSTLRWTDTSAAEAGQFYTYRIVARHGDEEFCSLSAASEARSACRPEIPENVTAVNTSRGISLTWEKTEYATGYSIYRSTNGTKWSHIKTVNGGDTLSWTNTSCKSGYKYHYRIRALVKIDGNTYRGDFADIPAIYRLSRPSLKKISVLDDGVRLSWKRVSGANGYQIWRSCEGAPAELISTVEGGKTLSFTDHTAVETGKVYTYSLTAWKEAENRLHLSEHSSPKSVIHPEPPADFAVTRDDAGNTLTWEPAEHATGYEIFRSKNGRTWSRIKTLSQGDAHTWTDRSNSAISQSHYRIRTLSSQSGVSFKSGYSPVLQPQAIQAAD